MIDKPTSIWKALIALRRNGPAPTLAASETEPAIASWFAAQAGCARTRTGLSVDIPKAWRKDVAHHVLAEILDRGDLLLARIEASNPELFPEGGDPLPEAEDKVRAYTRTMMGHYYLSAVRKRKRQRSIETTHAEGTSQGDGQVGERSVMAEQENHYGVREALAYAMNRLVMETDEPRRAMVSETLAELVSLANHTVTMAELVARCMPRSSGDGADAARVRNCLYKRHQIARDRLREIAKREGLLSCDNDVDDSALYGYGAAGVERRESLVAPAYRNPEASGEFVLTSEGPRPADLGEDLAVSRARRGAS